MEENWGHRIGDAPLSSKRRLILPEWFKYLRYAIWNNRNAYKSYSLWMYWDLLKHYKELVYHYRFVYSTLSDFLAQTVVGNGITEELKERIRQILPGDSIL